MYESIPSIFQFSYQARRFFSTSPVHILKRYHPNEVGSGSSLPFALAKLLQLKHST